MEQAKLLETPQPDTVTLQIPGGTSVYLSHYRVSDRVPQSILAVTPANLLFQEFDPQIDPSLLRSLDKPLYLREKLKDVYSYLSKALKDDYLSYEPPETDREYVSDAIQSITHLANIFNSARIRQGNTVFNRVILNTSIYVAKDPNTPQSSVPCQMVCQSLFCMLFG